MKFAWVGFHAEGLAALQALLDTHDALRLRLEYRAEGEDPALHVEPRGAVKAEDCLTRIDLSGSDEAEA